MNHKIVFATIVLNLLLLPCVVRSQEISGDTLRVSESIANMIVFPDSIQNVDLLCSKENYDFIPDNRKLKVKAATPTAVSPCSIVVNEGNRTHQFVLILDNGPITDVYHDYGSAEKLKNRVEFLKTRNAKPAPAPAPVQPAPTNSAQTNSAPVAPTDQAPAGAVSVVSSADPSVMVLGDLTIKRDEFEKRITDKLNLLAQDMTILIDHSNPTTVRNQTVDAAMKLFNDDTSVKVQVKGKDGIKTEPVKTYLNKLKLLNYSKPAVKIGNIQFISDIKLQPDGTYAGYVTYIQVITGIRGDKVPYKDTTKKTVRIIIKVWDDVKNGKMWDVYLGDILVEDTSKK